MEAEAVKEWLVPISTFLSLITVAIGAWLSLREYRLKLQAETRLKYASQVELDVQLLKLFTTIMDIAHARGGYHVSEKAIERMLTPEVLKELGIHQAGLRELLDDTIVRLPVGVAAQDAAIAAIWALGKRHEILYPMALQGLRSLMDFKADVAEEYLRDLEAQRPDSALRLSSQKA